MNFYLESLLRLKKAGKLNDKNILKAIELKFITEEESQKLLESESSNA